MSTRERFQFELLKFIIFFHNDYSLKYHEMVKVLKEVVNDAEEAMESTAGGEDEWFDDWMERQASWGRR